MEHELNFLLMGKTGHGKSATGNSILDRKVFETSSGWSSGTKEVQNGFTELENYTLMVVDGPGLEDTDMDKVQDIEIAVNNMTTALAMCYGGVDAFLFVYKFGTRFTAEEKSALEALKRIFGPKYMNHVIVVMTGGDNYQISVAQGECDRNFHEWCRQQAGELRQLYEDCEGRFVLFNNWEKDEEKKKKPTQVQELVQLAQDLRDKYGRYTSQCFKDSDREREKLIVEKKAPELTREIQKSIALLCADIDRLSKQPSQSKKKRIASRIQDLKRKIEVQDKGFGVLVQLKEEVEQAETYLDDVEKLQSLAKHLEIVRLAKKIWAGIVAVIAVIRGSRPAGKILSIVTATDEFIISGARKALENKHNNLKKQLRITEGSS